MRTPGTLGAFVAATLLLAAQGASAATASCLSSGEQSAFDVGALKSELTVTAVACGNDDDYNHFVELHRKELVAEDAAVNAWFKRTYGRVAQPRYDTYITLLANEQSETAQKEGSDFCPRYRLLFPEAMAVPSADLRQYAAAKELVPTGFSVCAPERPAAASRPAAPSRRAAAKHRS